jgi:hypothetical protein
MGLFQNLLLLPVLAFAFTNSSFAQQANENTAIAMTPLNRPTEETAIHNDQLSATGNMSRSIIGNYPRLMKRFSRLFQNASNQSWIEVNQILFVSFLKNGQKTRACFTKDGSMNYAITDYNLKRLPAGLQQYIKTHHPCYTVLNAIEIQAYNTTVHQVILENAGGFVTLKSTADGVEETSHVSKQ